MPAHRQCFDVGYSIVTVPTMKERKKHQLLTYFIASVWFANGLFCKVLNLVPRHEEIVMGVWILSGLWTKLNGITQILVIAIMNTLEFFLVPDLLLWGRLNSLWAFVFILLIYYNQFRLNEKLQPV